MKVKGEKGNVTRIENRELADGNCASSEATIKEDEDLPPLQARSSFRCGTSWCEGRRYRRRVKGWTPHLASVRVPAGKLVVAAEEGMLPVL